MVEYCKGCGEEMTSIPPALSRYGHGDICSECGTTEALVGDFIKRYEKKVDTILGIYPLDFALQDHIIL